MRPKRLPGENQAKSYLQWQDWGGGPTPNKDFGKSKVLVVTMPSHRHIKSYNESKNEANLYGNRGREKGASLTLLGGTSSFLRGKKRGKTRCERP